MKKSALYMSVIFVITCIAAYFTYTIFTYPLVGIKAAPIGDGYYAVTDVYPDSWAYMQGIRNGDHVVPEGDYGNGVREHNRIEKIHTLLIKKGSTDKSVLIRYEGSSMTYLFYSFFPLVLFMLTLGISLYMFRRFKETESILVLSVFLLTVSICYVSGWVSARFDEIGLYVMGLSLVICPVLFVHFIYQVYREHSILLFSKVVLYILYSYAIVCSALSYIYVYIFQASSSIYLFLFLLTAIAAALLIYRKCRHYRHVLNHAKLKLAVYTVLFSFLPFCLFYALPKLLLGIEIISAEYTACFLVILPVATLYALMNEALHDIDYVLRRMFYYVLLSCIPALALVIGFYFLNPAPFQWISYIRIYLLCWAMMAALLFIKEEADVGMESRLVFNKARYEASLLRFSKAVMNSTNTHSILEHLMDEIKKVLYVKHVYKLEFLKVEQRFCIAGDDCWLDVAFLGEMLIHERLALGAAVRGEQGYFLLVGETSELYTCIFIGYKKSHIRLNHHDRVWLHTISLHTNVLLQSFVHVQELLREFERTRDESGDSSLLLSKMLFTVSETERERLSQDIHDTLLQELILIYHELEHGQDMAAAREHLIQQIQYIREECYRLRPPFLLEMGLLDGLQALIADYQMKEHVLIEFVSNMDDSETLDDWHTVHLYRIMQELLHNARKHARAKCIFVSLYQKENKLLLVYEDDGLGMDMNTLGTMKRHFGLAGMRERTRTMNGELSISSAPNEGMLIKIEIPLQVKGKWRGGYHAHTSVNC